MIVRFLPLGPQDPTEIAGYALRARLGSGGMGNVYLSFTRGGRPIAIKVVKETFADDPEFRRRFAREVAAAQRVQGHYTAPVLDADPDARIPWLATAYIAGPSLQAAVVEHGPFPPLSVFRLLAGAAEGVAAVHAAGLIHRDLKPSNVLLSEDGPRVIDFGIAHAANSSTLTSTGQAIGSPAFMAPEQVRGKVTEATDVFALAHLTMYAATGHTAFGDGHTEALFYRIINDEPDLDGCPDAIRVIVHRCLAKEPADRPGLNEVIAAAREPLAGQTMQLLGTSWLPRPIAETLRAYDTRVAPLPPAPTQTWVPGRTPSPGTAPDSPAPVYPAPAPASPTRRETAARRRLLRPAATIPAVVILVAGGYLGYRVGHGSDVPKRGPAASTSATARHSARPSTSTTAAASQSAQASVSPLTSTSPQPSGSASASGSGTSSQAGVTLPGGYMQEYSDDKNNIITMPGGGCTSGWSYPSYLTFTAIRAEVTTDTSGGGDLELGCNEGPNGSAEAGIDFGGHEAAVVTRSPDAQECDAAVASHPLIGSIVFSQLSVGEQFCVTDQNSGQLARVTLTAKDDSSYNLSWSVTAWSLPST